jgi:ribosomal protein S18 acetylase RimI-like enzyme
MADYTIRTFDSADLAKLLEITAATFAAVSIDGNIEKHFGTLPRSDWRKRKLAAIQDDCRIAPSGVFVAADSAGDLVGYVTTRADLQMGVGSIPNLAVDPAHQKRGLARMLLQHALNHFRQLGLALARIETLQQNPVGQHLYPALGFVEVARQIHYAMKLSDAPTDEQIPIKEGRLS